MKKLILPILTVLIFNCISVKSQTFLEHGLGINVGITNDPTRWFIIPEYELSFLNESKGYKQGFVTGAGVSLNISGIGDYAPFIKAGYRLSNISFGIKCGIKKEDLNEYPYGNKVSSNFGGWVSFNANNNIKIQATGDGFSGIGIGVIFRLHGVK